MEWIGNSLPQSNDRSQKFYGITGQVGCLVLQVGKGLIIRFETS